LQRTLYNSKFKELFPWMIVLFLIFAIPAIIVRIAMEDVPERSEIKVVTTFQSAVNLVEGTFKKHDEFRKAGGGLLQGQLEPVPDNAMSWIVRLNPMGRLAPGGGPAVLKVADPKTGAIGLEGDDKSVTISIPAYRTLKAHSTTIYARSQGES